jgi:uncharacterized damage-inducible protein DinB
VISAVDNPFDGVGGRWQDCDVIKTSEISRVDPPSAGSERELLSGFLDYHRETLLMKCADLSAEQLKSRNIEPSTLSLLGLLRHMAEVERGWFRGRIAREEAAKGIYFTDADPDGDFDNLDSATAEEVLATYRDEVSRARKIFAESSLDDTHLHPRHGETSVRWVMLHMIEEYARHNGHADLLRQRIDGVTGE